MDYLFDVSEFVARGRCGRWDVDMRLIYQLSHFGIFLEYVSITFLLFYFARQIELAGFNPLVRYKLIRDSAKRLPLTMGSFILLCGLGHLFDGFGAFYFPAYRFFTYWHLLTFLVGLWSTMRLILIFRQQYLYFVRLAERLERGHHPEETGDQGRRAGDC